MFSIGDTVRAACNGYNFIGERMTLNHNNFDYRTGDIGRVIDMSDSYSLKIEFPGGIIKWWCADRNFTKVPSGLFKTIVDTTDYSHVIEISITTIDKLVLSGKEEDANRLYRELKYRNLVALNRILKELSA